MADLEPMIRSARMLLIRAGLSEDEADQVLRRLHDERGASEQGDEAGSRRAIEGELAQIRARLDRQEGPMAHATTIAEGAIGGILANTLTETIIDAPRRPAAPTIPYFPEGWRNTIQVQWDDASLQARSIQSANAIRRALQIREAQHGTHDSMVALYLDGLAMYESLRRNHENAKNLRRRGLKILQAVEGPFSESIANCWSNLSMDLFHLRDHHKAASAMANALTAIRKSVGDSHPSTVGVVYNAMSLLSSRGGLPPEHLAKIRRQLSEFKEAAAFMLNRKSVFLLLSAATDLLAEISSSLRTGRKA